MKDGDTLWLDLLLDVYLTSSLELLGCGSPDAALGFCSRCSSLNLGKKAGCPLPLLHCCFAELKQQHRAN